jgi:hypothetical protein
MRRQQLIYPSNYHKKLVGGIVELHFTLTHFIIADKGKNLKSVGNNIYTPDMHPMRILKKPSLPVVVPCKRIVALKDSIQSGSGSIKRMKTRSSK